MGETMSQYSLIYFVLFVVGACAVMSYCQRVKKEFEDDFETYDD